MKQILIFLLSFSGISIGLAQPQRKVTFGDSLDHLKTLNSGKSDSITVKERYAARLFPNPARNKVQIAVMGFEPGYLELKFYDIHGNKLRDEKRLMSIGTETIPVMFLLQPGVYLLFIKQNKRSLKKILVVQ